MTKVNVYLLQTTCMMFIIFSYEQYVAVYGQSQSNTRNSSKLNDLYQNVSEFNVVNSDKSAITVKDIQCKNNCFKIPTKMKNKTDWLMQQKGNNTEQSVHFNVLNNCRLCEDLNTINFPISKNTKVSLKLSKSMLILSLLTKNQTMLSRSIGDSVMNFMSSANKNKMLSYILIPAVMISGVVPWILPGIKIAAGVVQMMNQMAFTAGLVSLVRGYIFDKKPSEHVVYVNHGYHKSPYKTNWNYRTKD